MCRLVNFKMTLAKLSIFIEADGRDIYDGTPLVKIRGGCKPVMSVMPVPNANGAMDMRARPRWDKWECLLNVRFDEDQFSTSDVVNLFLRVGSQGGMGEGRPNSKNGNGLDYGLFRVELPE
jgi:hypothetical protein